MRTTIQLDALLARIFQVMELKTAITRMFAKCHKRTFCFWTADIHEVYHLGDNFCTKTPPIGVLLLRFQSNNIASSPRKGGAFLD